MPQRRKLRRMTQAMPQLRPDRLASTRRSFAWGSASFALVLESFTIAHDCAMRVRRDRPGGHAHRPNVGMAATRFERPRDHHYQAAVCRLLKNRGRFFCRGETAGSNRSAHSTNVVVISLRTIITRKMRSSWTTVAGARSGRLKGPVSSPRRGERRRRSASHRSDQSDHVLPDHFLPVQEQCRSDPTAGDVSDCTARIGHAPTNLVDEALRHAVRPG